MDTLASVITDRSRRLESRLLAAIAVEYSRQAGFGAPPRPSVGERTFACVRRTDSYDVWVIHWGPGSATPMHDHGDSNGALLVVDGTLVERLPAPDGSGRVRRKVLRRRARRLMARNHVHEVANESAAGATTVHVYSPPLSVMNHYERAEGVAPRVVHRELIRESRGTHVVVA